MRSTVGDRFVRLLAAALLFISLHPPMASAAETVRFAPDFPSIQLPSPLRGEPAVDSLSHQLPGIAAFYGKSTETLARQLREDKSLWVDRQGRLFFVCDTAAFQAAEVPGETNAVTPPLQLAPLNQTFLLHSKPGSTRTIFLDFDGHTISGTAWNANYNGGGDIVAPAWNTDGDPNSFSNGEMTAIQQIWLRVAEDFAPFDVDVTTEFPGEAALTRSNNGDQVYGTRALVSAIGGYFNNPGGLAYVGVFNDTGDYYKPALVFPENLSNSEKNIAEAISHEVGHNLGLSHDGIIGGEEYYSGQGNWAPIMGVGYYQPLSQWSKGEYANANNTEDDLLIITQHGLTYRADDHGNTRFAATLLSGTAITNTGIVERSTDVDFLGFNTGAGLAQFNITPAERGANLHLMAALYNASGLLLTTREISDTTSGSQPISFNLSVSSGMHYLSIAGSGSGDAATTGYSSYGSLGQYTVTISLPGISSWLPVAGGAYQWAELANWSAGIPDVIDANARMTNNIEGDQLISLQTPVTVGRLLLGDADGSHPFTIEDGAGGPLVFNTTGLDATLVKTAGTNDEIKASITLSRRLVISNSTPADLILSGSISGANGLTKTGPGRLILAGTNAFSGDTLIRGGSVTITGNGSISNSPQVKVDSSALLDVTGLNGWIPDGNQTLSGSGTVLGDVILSSGATVDPGSEYAGTLKFSNNLSVADGGNLVFDLAPVDTVGEGTNDLIEVMGNLSIVGSNIFSIKAAGDALLSPGNYTVLRYGSLTGNPAGLVHANASTRYQVTVDDSVSGEIRLHITGEPSAITWRGDGGGNTWDVAGASNWFNGTDIDRFYQLDDVAFDDSGSNSPAISLNGTLTPGSVTVNSTRNYSFSGPGRLGGAMSLVKLGSGILTVSTANEFTGPIQIEGGIVRPTVAAALGATNPVVIQSGGTLDLNALNLGNRIVAVEGAGASGSGAILNSSPTAQNHALRNVTLTGDTTFGGNGRWDIRADPTGTLTGNGFNLTKTGAGEMWWVDLGATGLGDIAVRQGLLGVQGNTTLGNSAKRIALSPGTTLSLSGSSALSKMLSMTNSVFRNDAGSNSLIGAITLISSNLFNVTSTLHLSGPIDGNGALAKRGTGTLILAGPPTFTGPFYLDSASTSASDGIVRLTGSGVLGASTILIRNNNSGTSTLQLQGNAQEIILPQTITLSGRNNNGVAIQSVSGTNRISGNIALQTGGSNYLFQSDSGLLTFTGLLPTSTPGGTRTLTFQGSGDHLISGTIQNGGGGGTVGLRKSGSGKLTITGAINNYTGLSTVNAGTLQLGNGGPGGRLGAGPVVNNGILQFNRSDSFTWNNDVSGATGRLIKVNTNTITLSATNLYLSESSGAVQINGGTLQVNPTGRLVANNELWIGQGASTGSVVLNGGVLISSNWIAVGRNSSVGSGTLTINSGSVQKLGGGNIILGSLGGTGTLIVNGGTVGNNARLLLGESSTGKGYLHLNGGTVQATGVARFGGLIAAAYFNGGTLQATTNNIAFISNLTQAQVQSGGVVLDDNGFTLTNSQILMEDGNSPGGGFTKMGSGLLSLNSLNTFRGQTRIRSGTLKLGNSGALQNSTLNLAATDSGSLSFGTLSAAVIGGLAGERSLLLANASGSAVTLTVGGNNSNTIYAGSLSGPGSLIKAGAGTLTLEGASSHAGSTTVNAGALVLNGSLDSGITTINSGLLTGNGILNGTLSVQSPATLAPGASVGSILVNQDATLTGTLVIEIDGATNDTLNVTGTLSFGGSLVVTNLGAPLEAGASFRLFSAGTFIGTFAEINLPQLPAQLRWNTSQLTSAGTLSIIDISPSILASLAGSNLLLEFPTETGLKYLVETTTNLAAPVLWLPQSTNEGSGSILSLPIPIDFEAPPSFFRIGVY